MKFTQFGVGFIGKMKTGGVKISLVLDPQTAKLVPAHQWENEIYLFEKRSGKGNIYYSVCTSMPDNYQYESGLTKQQKKERSTQGSPKLSHQTHQTHQNILQLWHEKKRAIEKQGNLTIVRPTTQPIQSYRENYRKNLFVTPKNHKIIKKHKKKLVPMKSI